MAFFGSNFFKEDNNSEENAGILSDVLCTGERYYNKDGSVNIKSRGVLWRDRKSLYYNLTSLSTTQLVIIVFAFIIFTNLLFAVVYFYIGVEYFEGITSTNKWHQLLDIFFFSTQTFATVGYGRINPLGTLVNFIASIESFIGLSTFALATGLFYGKFSKPRAFIRYSQCALISPQQDGSYVFNFRLISYKNNSLSELQATVICAMQVMENGKWVNKFHKLALEYSNVSALLTNWSVVHKINQDSPLYGMSKEDMKRAGIEIIVFLKAFDEYFSSSVVSRTSYTADEIIYGAVFKHLYQVDEEGRTIVRLSHVDDYDMV